MTLSTERTAIFEAEAIPNMGDIYRVASRMMTDSAKANDVVQETFLIAWKRFDSYQPGSNCRAWLFQIMFNVVRHERRRWFKWGTGKEEDLADMPLAAPETIPDRLQDADILAAIDKLPANYREVLMMVDVEEFSYKEASEIIGIPIGTVMSRLSRARTQLRSELSGVAASYNLIPASR